MAVNSAVTVGFQAGPVPPDRECTTNLSETLQGIEDFGIFNVTDPAQVASDGSSIANQALSVANAALASSNATAARLPQQRFSGENIPVDPGPTDSTVSLTWSPAMPSNRYTVVVTLYGPSPTASSAWSYYVIEGSNTVDGCSVRLNNLPSTPGFSIAWSVTSVAAPVA